MDTTARPHHGRLRRPRPHPRALVALVLVWSLVPASPGAAAPETVADGTPRTAREVRTVYTSEFGLPRPSGVAYHPEGDGGLVVVDAGASGVRLDGEDQTGSFELGQSELGQSELGAVAVGPDGALAAVIGDEVVEVSAAQLQQQQPTVEPTGFDLGDVVEVAGATFDDRGNLLVLDAASSSLVRSGSDGQDASSVPLRAGDSELRGVAFNPADGLVYVLSAEDELLYAVDEQGRVQDRYELSEVSLLDPRDMTFAPSSDPSDGESAMSLFIADAGSEELFGGVTEVTLAQVAATSTPVVDAQLVQMIDTSQWVPASPDPSGVTYLPASDRLTVVDSEVNETTGAGYHGVNVWEVTRTGTVTRGWNTLSFTNEPTGVSHDPATNRLFIASDARPNGIHIVQAGADGLFGTADDTRTFLNTAVLGLTDTEDPEFDPATGHLFFLDGVSTTVYRADPVDGVFGNGNDLVTSFDVGRYGPTDVEGLAIDQARGTLLVGDRRSRQIYEVTKSGELVRQINARVAGMTFLSGMSMAPASSGSGRMNIWITDRAVDNGPDPTENDGKLFELTLGSVEGTAPVIGSVVVEPGVPGPDDTLTAVVEASGGGGPLTYAYQWLKNGSALVGETGSTLDLSVAGNGDVGDELAVRVVASDGTLQSEPVTSAVVTVVGDPGGGDPGGGDPGGGDPGGGPVFDQDLADRTDAEGDTVSFSAGASGAEGAVLSYAASGLPPEVSIDADTGLISGTIAAGAAADSPYDVTVTVSDESTSGPSSGIGLVQGKAGDQSGVNSLSLTYDQAPRAGNLLVAFGHYGANRVPTIPPGWSLALESNTGSETVVFYRVAGANEPAEVTLTASGAALHMSLSIFEYAGMHDVQSEVLDRSVFSSASGVNSVSTGVTQTTRYDNELLLASVGLNGTRTFENAWTNGFVQRTDTRRQTVAQRIASSTGQFETTESWTGNTVGNAVGSLVAFRAAAGGSSPGGGSATDSFTWTVTAPTDPTAPVIGSVVVEPGVPGPDQDLPDGTDDEGSTVGTPAEASGSEGAADPDEAAPPPEAEPIRDP
jgi:uncharacterized protein YjiK